ncbi:MAG: hypothetical protein H6598_06315 [Flavobacteriales bacterium]|nr:hypothetical protein [Flavobacteriales bacterium]
MILILSFARLYAQDLNKFTIDLGVSSWYAMTIDQAYPINNQFSMRPLPSISINNEKIYISRKGEVESKMLYSPVLPSFVSIGDTLSVKMRGFIFSNLYGKDLFQEKIEWIAINGLIGFNTGRLVNPLGSRSKLKNSFFMPCAEIQLRLFFGKIGITFLANYGIDISSPAWKISGTQDYPNYLLENWRPNRLSFGASIGHLIHG